MTTLKILVASPCESSCFRDFGDQQKRDKAEKYRRSDSERLSDIGRCRLAAVSFRALDIVMDLMFGGSHRGSQTGRKGHT
jgi:hypothetical protein